MTFRQVRQWWPWYHEDYRSKWRKMARAAFEHPGYLPSIARARADAAQSAKSSFAGYWRDELRRVVAERDRLEDRLKTTERMVELRTKIVMYLTEERDQLKAEIAHLRDLLAARPKSAKVERVEDRDAALVRATRGG